MGRKNWSIGVLELWSSGLVAIMWRLEAATTMFKLVWSPGSAWGTHPFPGSARTDTEAEPPEIRFQAEPGNEMKTKDRGRW